MSQFEHLVFRQELHSLEPGYGKLALVYHHATGKMERRRTSELDLGDATIKQDDKYIGPWARQ